MLVRCCFCISRYSKPLKCLVSVDAHSSPIRRRHHCILLLCEETEVEEKELPQGLSTYCTRQLLSQ